MKEQGSVVHGDPEILGGKPVSVGLECLSNRRWTTSRQVASRRGSRSTIGVKEAIVIALSIAFVLLCGLTAPLNAQTPPAATVFQNVRIFDGKVGQLSGPSHVLVRGNMIEHISSTPITADRY